MKKILYILIGILFSTSCSNEFVELAPHDFLNSESFYKTKDDYNAAVIAAYAKLQGQVAIYFELVEWRSDNLDLAAPTAGTQDRYNINKFQETSANGILQNAWANFYNGIFRTNVITDRIKDAGFDENLKNQFEAEARFIRALTYFNVVRIWGDAPIVTNEVSAAESLKIGRSSTSEVYQTIEEDLEFAIANLPASYPSTDFGRATSGAAKALLGQVYLTEKKYSQAITVLDDVADQYSLLPNIADVFNPDNKSNNEVIFSIRFNKEVLGEGHGLWFGITDISTSPLTSKLINSYSSNDDRKSLIDYQTTGNQLVPGKYFDSSSIATRNYGNDFIVLREADVLLMLAEALNEQNFDPSGKAFANLNKVRNRAGLSDFTPTELPSQTSFRNAVLHERYLEFPLEAQRWFDLARTNTAQTEVNSGIGLNIQNYQLLYPVPQAEIEKINNTAIFSQNEGY